MAPGLGDWRARILLALAPLAAAVEWRDSDWDAGVQRALADFTREQPPAATRRAADELQRQVNALVEQTAVEQQAVEQALRGEAKMKASPHDQKQNDQIRNMQDDHMFYMTNVEQLQKLFDKDLKEVNQFSTRLKEKIAAGVKKFIAKLKLLKESTFMNTKNKLTKWKNNDMLEHVHNRMARKKSDESLEKAQSTFSSAQRKLNTHIKAFKTDWRKMVDKTFRDNINRKTDSAVEQVEIDERGRKAHIMTTEAQLNDRIAFSAEQAGKSAEQLIDTSIGNERKVNKKVNELIKMGTFLYDDVKALGNNVNIKGPRAISIEHNQVAQKLNARNEQQIGDNENFLRDGEARQAKILQKVERDVNRAGEAFDRDLGQTTNAMKRDLERMSKDFTSQLTSLQSGDNRYLDGIEKSLTPAQHTLKGYTQMNGAETARFENQMNAAISGLEEKQKADQEALAQQLALEKSAAEGLNQTDQNAADKIKSETDQTVKLATAQDQQLQEAGDSGIDQEATAAAMGEQSVANRMDDANRQTGDMMADMANAEHSIAKQQALSDEAIDHAGDVVLEDAARADGLTNQLESTVETDGAAAQASANEHLQQGAESAKQTLDGTLSTIEGGFGQAAAAADSTVSQVATSAAGRTGALEQDVLLSNAQQKAQGEADLAAVTNLEGSLRATQGDLDAADRDTERTGAQLRAASMDQKTALREAGAQVGADQKAAVDQMAARGESDETQAAAEMSALVASSEQESRQEQARFGASLQLADEVRAADATTMENQLRGLKDREQRADEQMQEEAGQFGGQMMTTGNQFAQASKDIADGGEKSAHELAMRTEKEEQEMDKNLAKASQESEERARQQAQPGGAERALEQDTARATNELKKQLGKMEGADMHQVNRLAQGAGDLEKWVAGAAQQGEQNAQQFLTGFQQIQDATMGMLGKVQDGEVAARQLAQGQEAMSEKLLQQTLAQTSASAQEQLRSVLNSHHDKVAAAVQRATADGEDAREAIVQLKADTTQQIKTIMSKEDTLRPQLRAYERQENQKDEELEQWLKKEEADAAQVTSNRAAQDRATQHEAKEATSAVLKSVVGAIDAAETLGQNADKQLRKIEDEQAAATDQVGTDGARDSHGLEAELATATRAAEQASRDASEDRSWATGVLLRSSSILGDMAASIDTDHVKLQRKLAFEQARAQQSIAHVSDERKLLMSQLRDVLDEALDAGHVVFTGRTKQVEQLDKLLDTQLYYVSKDARMEPIIKKLQDQGVLGELKPPEGWKQDPYGLQSGTRWKGASRLEETLRAAASAAPAAALGAEPLGAAERPLEAVLAEEAALARGQKQVEVSARGVERRLVAAQRLAKADLGQAKALRRDPELRDDVQQLAELADVTAPSTLATRLAELEARARADRRHRQAAFAEQRALAEDAQELRALHRR